MSHRTQFILLFFFLLVFRTLFGLSQPFFSPDEMQTYLIGLKVYTNHLWPFFGPDLIVTETGFYTQIPGALEGLCVGLPFYLLPIPEAPFILLNLMSLSALALLSWYISKKVREIPFLFVFAWLALIPWNLHESTNIINPSWLLFGGIFFFIGFLEALPDTSLNWLSPFTAFAWMGFGLFWCVQFHFSWILLPPFILIAFFWRRWRQKLKWAREACGLLLGSFFSGFFLIPTFIHFGLRQTPNVGSLTVGFNSENFLAFFAILARFFSLPSYELPRFLKIEAVKQIPWIIPPAILLTLVGWAQAVVLLVFGFIPDKQHKDWKSIYAVTGLAFCLVWFSFWFTSKPPQAHIYYILLPLISIYSFYVWGRLAVKRNWKIFGIICLCASFWFELSYLIYQMPMASLYNNREQVVKAIGQNDYRILGERRPESHN